MVVRQQGKGGKRALRGEQGRQQLHIMHECFFQTGSELSVAFLGCPGGQVARVGQKVQGIGADNISCKPELLRLLDEHGDSFCSCGRFGGIDGLQERLQSAVLQEIAADQKFL